MRTVTNLAIILVLIAVMSLTACSAPMPLEVDTHWTDGTVPGSEPGCRPEVGCFPQLPIPQE